MLALSPRHPPSSLPRRLWRLRLRISLQGILVPIPVNSSPPCLTRLTTMNVFICITFQAGQKPFELNCSFAERSLIPRCGSVRSERWAVC
jgi:hypothetical protein